MLNTDMGPGVLVLKNSITSSEFLTQKGSRMRRVDRCFCKKPDTRTGWEQKCLYAKVSPFLDGCDYEN
ncbi:hypothetical protein HPB50_028728 [Hyalomma asiaticum]|nr:hypothetical protein HPB50_028728 [Hyalomma asiaticum]